MANSVPFRTTPQLGPQLDDVFVGLPYWDLTGIQGVTPLTAPLSGITTPSYKLGNRETGDDGYDYIWVQNGATALAASARVNMDASFVTTANASGVLQGPAAAVPAGAYFHARVFAL